jgi:16S rRNA processing protein RimM
VLGFRRAPDPSGEEIEVGYVSGVFGVQGEVRLHLHHRESSLLSAGREVVLVDPRSGERWRVIAKAREGAGQRVLARIHGDRPIQRDEAAGLIGWVIMVSAADLPQLDAGEFWVWQVVGAEVVVDGSVVGKVIDVHSTGPVDVFEIAVAGQSDPAFVPSLAQFVVEVGARRLVLVAGALES